MVAVMSYSEKLTGKMRIEPAKSVFSFTGVRLEVEVLCNSFDTNSGYADPEYSAWRPATRENISRLDKWGEIT